VDGALAFHYIRARWALFERAVRTTGTHVAYTANVLNRVPRSGVSLGSFVSKLHLSNAAATAIAVAGAHSTLTSLAIVAVEALAFAGLAVASALCGALGSQVGAVLGSGVVNPCTGLGAGTLGAIVVGVGRVRTLGAGIARALVVLAT